MTKSRADYKREWYSMNRTRILDTRRKYLSEYNEKNPDKQLLRNAKARAAKKGFDFNINEEDLNFFTHCPVLNRPFIRGTKYAPSIDRIDSSKGYIKGNVQVMSRLANRMKNDATVEELQEFAQWVLKTYPL